MLPRGRGSYFEEVERKRYELEPFIRSTPSSSRHEASGCWRWVSGSAPISRASPGPGPEVTGIDFSEHSVELARRRLELEGLQGDVRVADAESLPVRGRRVRPRVLVGRPAPHARHTERVAESRPRASTRRSAMRDAVRPAFMGGVRAVGSARAIDAPPRATLSDVLASHMESHGTKAYTVAELRTMFKGLEDMTIEPVITAYDRRVAGLWRASSHPGSVGSWSRKAAGPASNSPRATVNLGCEAPRSRPAWTNLTAKQTGAPA